MYDLLGGRSLNNGQIPEDPVPLYYAIQGKSVPIIAYTEEQQCMLDDDDFSQLLQVLESYDSVFFMFICNYCCRFMIFVIICTFTQMESHLFDDKTNKISTKW